MVRGTFSPARAWRPAVVARLARTLGIEDQTLSRISCRQTQMQAISAHRRLALLSSRRHRSPREQYKVGHLRIALEASERFSNDGYSCSARVRQAGTRDTGRGDSSRMANQRAPDRSVEEERQRQLARAAVALRVACKFKAKQTHGEFRQSIVHQYPMPNPLVELTRYGMAPRLPRACASRIVALASQGATPPRSAHRER